MDVLRRAKVGNKRKHAPEQNTNYGSAAFGQVEEEKNSEEECIVGKKKRTGGILGFQRNFQNPTKMHLNLHRGS